MGAFMGYMVEVAIIMTVLFIVYKALLSGLSFHSFKRKVILSIYAAAWILPSLVSLYNYLTPHSPFIEIGVPEMSLEAVSEAPQTNHLEWTYAFGVLYFAGMTVIGFITGLSVFKMTRIIRKGRKMAYGEYDVRVSSKAPGPFSWGKYIVVRPSDLDSYFDLVMAHETTHLRKWHWVDLILARLTVILQWFSPAAWLLARELRETHEYEVDEIAANENSYEYQLMLIKKTAGIRFPVFADSLNQSQIKKRLTMMRKKSNPRRRLAALALPMSAIAATLLLTQPVIAKTIDKLATAEYSAAIDDKINENNPTLQVVKVSGENREKKGLNVVFIANDGTEASQNPDAEDKATYFVDGNEYNGPLSDIDPSSIASITIRKDDPAYPDNKVMIITKKEDTNYAGDRPAAIDKLAEFKGGEKELMAFLAENIKYPAAAVGTLDGPVRVIVSFNIQTDGNVNDITVRKSGGEVFDAEAISAVSKTSGRWEPAEVEGKPVVSQFTLPITFSTRP